MKKKIIFTIGHSTRSLDELLNVLKHYKIKVLADVRHFPHSKRNPQFNKELLEKELSDSGIRYIWIENLGGFRNEGYEEYMKTEDFRNGLVTLTEVAKQKATAVMCAEVLWFRCHRRFIVSALTKEKWQVSHIYNEKKSEAHRDLGKKTTKQLSLILNDRES
jgi:uncharacterized protein (DUF488 family)